MYPYAISSVHTWPLHDDIPDALAAISNRLHINGNNLFAAAVEVVGGRAGRTIRRPWLSLKLDERPYREDCHIMNVTLHSGTSYLSQGFEDVLGSSSC